MSLKNKITDIFLNEKPSLTIESDDDYNTKFRELGIDSLDLMIAMLKVGEAFSIELDEKSLENIATLNDLINFVESNT